MTSAAEPKWCDWCGEEAEPPTLRTFDGRVFCGEACLQAYARQTRKSHPEHE